MVWFALLLLVRIQEVGALDRLSRFLVLYVAFTLCCAVQRLVWYMYFFACTTRLRKN